MTNIFIHPPSRLSSRKRSKQVSVAPRPEHNRDAEILSLQKRVSELEKKVNWLLQVERGVEKRNVTSESMDVLENEPQTTVVRFSQSGQTLSQNHTSSAKPEHFSISSKKFHAPARRSSIRSPSKSVTVWFSEGNTLFETHQPALIVKELKKKIPSMGMHCEFVRQASEATIHRKVAFFVTSMADGRNVRDLALIDALFQKCNSHSAQLVVIVLVNVSKSIDMSQVQNISHFAVVIGHKFFKPHKFVSKSSTEIDKLILYLGTSM